MQSKMQLESKINCLPHAPGCYLFKDSANNLIYVGKAKDLQKRVASYLNKASNFKTMQLVNDIVDLEYITTSNEKEALILEQTLIKNHHPKYNILLADDKKYPYIQITNSKDPQYRYVRSANRDQGRYYGPFPDGSGAREILKLLERIFPLRKCKGNLDKPCLYYHLDQCSGACFKDVPDSYYHEFFKGNIKEISEQLTTKMMISANNLQFEAANRIKLLLIKIELFLSSQAVEFQDYLNRDFINFIVEDNIISIVTLFHRNGKLQAKDEQVVVNNYLHLNDFIRNYCQQLYSKNTLPQIIYLPKIIDFQDLKLLFTKVKFIHPLKGSKAKLLNLAKTNALHAYNNFLKNDHHANQAMVHLGRWLKIANLKHCEIFDVSKLQQSAIVGGMIVYKDAKPSPNDYRKYLLDVNLRDDYHRFLELIYRRYYYLVVNRLPLPDLIIVDGGKLQVKATNQQLELLNLTIPVIGLVKNKQHQTDHIIDKNYQVINIPKTDSSFIFLSKLQDQVHNYK